MKSKDFIKVSGIIFAIVGSLHLLRFFLGWNLMVGDYDVHQYASLVGGIVALYLSYSAYKLNNK